MLVQPHRSLGKNVQEIVPSRIPEARMHVADMTLPIHVHAVLYRRRDHRDPGHGRGVSTERDHDDVDLTHRCLQRGLDVDAAVRCRVRLHIGKML